MSFILSLQSEILKTKRTVLWYLTICAAAVVPLIMITDTVISPEATNAFKMDPWNLYFKAGMDYASTLVLPVYVILICTLLPQIEYKNNTWKQLLASPQSLRNVFFSKLFLIQLLIILFFFTLSFLMAFSALLVNVLVPDFNLLQYSIDWEKWFILNLQAYFSILGISAFQFWLGLRSRSFIIPVAVGIGLIMLAAVLHFEIKWENVDMFPFAFPILIIMSKYQSVLPLILWSSLAYAAFFLGLAFLDFRLRKIKVG
ncbi:ABC transporter permease [Nafulsella turpanensis]|uniref:ABC transporter permease n=1 Tax=Nafulsella turpanensis TaxID=1265690 RepID=UPI00034BC71E|nr:ABC transporter permease [Nafulsella turpanensis]